MKNRDGTLIFTARECEKVIGNLDYGYNIKEAFCRVVQESGITDTYDSILAKDNRYYWLFVMLEAYNEGNIK